MFYQKLPIRLTQNLAAAGLSCKVSVVNLAMGAATVYQNFIALNRWGHKLAPDAIISFSQFNEIYLPWAFKIDANVGAEFAGGMQKVFRYSASPPWLKTLARFFPGLVKRTSLGSHVRLYYLVDYMKEWKAAYGAATFDPNISTDPKERERRYREMVEPMPREEIMKIITTPVYAHSLESISRDFPDIPLFAVFQPSEGTPGGIHEMFDSIQHTVVDEHRYTNVRFFNLFDIWEKNNWFPGSFVDGVHLSNDGHERVTGYLSEYLDPFVRERCAQVTDAQSKPR